MQDNDQATHEARLTLDVKYDLNRVPPEKLHQLLKDLVQHALSEGLLTGHTEAEVASYEVTVVAKPEPLEEEAVARLMSHRIENGDLALEDIPNRLAKFGLMEPHTFVAEMRERIDMAEGQYD